MRVIAGAAGGRKLRGVPGDSARPTSDRVRESLFSILGERTSGANVLDLFAGAGTLGIECISRGAARCMFVDMNRAACRVIGANLGDLGMRGRALILCRNVFGALGDEASPIREAAPYDLIFADPPYALYASAEIVQLVGEMRILERNGVLIVEHSSRMPAPHDAAGLELVRQQSYGDTGISFYQYTSG